MSVYFYDLPNYRAGVKFSPVYENFEEFEKFVRTRDLGALEPFLEFLGALDEKEPVLDWLNSQFTLQFGVLQNLYNDYVKYEGENEFGPLGSILSGISRRLEIFLETNHPYVLRSVEGVTHLDDTQSLDRELNDAQRHSGKIAGDLAVIAALDPFFYIAYDYEWGTLVMLPYFIGQDFDDAEEGVPLNVLQYSAINPARLEDYTCFTFDLNKFAYAFYGWLAENLTTPNYKIRRFLNLPHIHETEVLPKAAVTFGSVGGEDEAALYELFPVYRLG